VLWYGEDVSLTLRAASVPELDQLLVRGLLFRLAADGLQMRDRTPGLRWDDAQVGDLDSAEPLLRHLERRRQAATS
jgi:hypothetical protein